MLIIEIISLASFLIIATIIVCGFGSNSEGLKMAGCVFLILDLGVHAVFQIGAEWQRFDAQDKYILTPKSSSL